MRILVTGHRGYIGPHLVNLLHNAGHHVTGVDADYFQGCNWEPLPEADREIRADFRTLTARDLEGFDCICHLAAISNDPMGDLNADLTYQVNRDGSIELARQARRAGVPRFLFAGSCSVYGKGETLDLDENAAFNPVSAYATSKVETEKHVSSLADSNFSPAFLRNATAFGYSPNLRIDLVANNLLACAIARGDIRIMSDGTPWRPLVHCHDIARAFVLFAEAPREKIHNQAVNIGANEQNYQVRDVGDAVARLVPKATIVYTGEVGPDPRNYRVKFDKLYSLFPEFRLKYNLQSGLEELLQKYQEHKFSLNDFNGDQFVRLRTLKKRLVANNLPANNGSHASSKLETMSAAETKAEILKLTRHFSRLTHAANRPGYLSEPREFVPGTTTVPYAGRVFTEDEVEAAVSATLDFWLTLGQEGEHFEKKLAEFLGVKSSVLCNSGSSANLLAVSALGSPRLGNQRLLPGDEIITVAAGFPTTVAPIIQNGFVPVFIDNNPDTLNGCIEQLESAFRPGKTKAVCMAHTLGNPFDLGATTEFCKRHDLWLIEDNCDALGCRYDGKFTGTFGDMSTQSFYPPHHLTLGEGGAVNIVESAKLRVIIESFRDWGRDCWCASGKDNTCGKRYDWQLGELPKGYDHKYTYSHFGYNLKPLDIQAAIGRVQLDKLPQFIQARIDNWEYLRRGLDDLSEFFTFMLPTHATGWTPRGFSWDTSGHKTVCSWFGFMMRVKPSAPFQKPAFTRYLEEKKIGNRMLFGGNLVRQPFFCQLKKDRPEAFRVVGDLHGADQIMNEALFLGTYPGLTKAMLDYIIDTVHAFVKQF